MSENWTSLRSLLHLEQNSLRPIPHCNKLLKLEEFVAVENRTERVLLQVFNHQSLQPDVALSECELVYQTSSCQARFPSSIYIKYLLVACLSSMFSFAPYPFETCISFDTVLPSRCL